MTLILVRDADTDRDCTVSPKEYGGVYVQRQWADFRWGGSTRAIAASSSLWSQVYHEEQQNSYKTKAAAAAAAART